MKSCLAGVAAVLFVFSMLGCSGGGPSSSATTPPTQPPTQPPAGSPVMQVLPTTFGFGKVTTGNTPAPLEVTVRNTGTAPLRVFSIGFTALSSPRFALSVTTGTRPCGSLPKEIAAGDACTFQVSFQTSTNGVFDANVQIASNDGTSPLLGVPIEGTVEAVNALTVRINQVETSCSSMSNPNAATAYVSVLDQGGFPLLGLTRGNFILTEGSPTSSDLLLGVNFVAAAYKSIAIEAVVDNSGSITAQPVAYAEMKSGFASLFDNLRGNDVGELINFGSVYEVTVAFPSPSSTSNPTNKAALAAALALPWTKGGNTLLYDSVYRAIDDVALQTVYRRAVIVATDGVDEGPTSGVPASTHTLAEVIKNAADKNVPVFTIGIGNSVNTSVLQQMATGTGGVFYLANTSQNLATIYQQLSSVLYQNQYILTFDQLARGPGTRSPLNVSVVSPLPADAPPSTITSCN